MKDVKLQEDFAREEDRKAKKRADEWAAREARIQDAMGRMADTVLKKTNAAEKELEARVMQMAEAKYKAAEDADKKKQEARAKRDAEIKATLDRQMMERREQKEKERAQNKQYVQMVLEKDERDNMQDKQKR